MDSPLGLKAEIRFMCDTEGINLNDLDPDHLDIVDGSTKSLVELMMRQEGISVQDLKEGSIYEFLDQGKNILGEDIDDADEYINKKYKMRKEEVNKVATLEEELEALLKVHNGPFHKDASEYVDKVLYFPSVANNRKRCNIVDKDADEGRVYFDGKPIPVKISKHVS